MPAWIGKAYRWKKKLTWNDVPGIHGILILDEAEAVHEFDLRDLTRAMGAKVFFDVLFGDWRESNTNMGQMYCQLFVAKRTIQGKMRNRQKCPWCVVYHLEGCFLFLPRGVLQTGHVLLFRVREKVHGKN